MASPRVASSSTIRTTHARNPRIRARISTNYAIRKVGAISGGQSLVFLVLVTPKISIPVGFTCYQPAPRLQCLVQTGKGPQKARCPQTATPPETTSPSALSPQTTTGPALACAIQRWTIRASACTVSWRMRSIAPRLLSMAPRPFSAGCKSSRKHGAIRISGCISASSTSPIILPLIPAPRRLSASGAVTSGSPWSGRARLYVCSHQTKRFIVAIKYEEEETYRYLMASDLTRRTLDIVQGHSLRWLVEVFVQDWKGHEGWAQLTKQPGEEGARRSVILSLLVDHALFVHPAQEAQLKNNLPAYTVGSLRQTCKSSVWSMSLRTWCLPMSPRVACNTSPPPCTRYLPSGAPKST